MRMHFCRKGRSIADQDVGLILLKKSTQLAPSAPPAACIKRQPGLENLSSVHPENLISAFQIKCVPTGRRLGLTVSAVAHYQYETRSAALSFGRTTCVVAACDWQVSSCAVSIDAGTSCYIDWVLWGGQRELDSDGGTVCLQVYQELDDKLQEEFANYLHERGVDEELGNYLIALVNDKEEQEYKRWLGNVRKFILK